MKNLLLAAGLLASLTAAAAQRAPERLSYRTYHYTCDAGRNVSVTYVDFGNVNFARLNYAGRQYALAPAISASGARFASLTGPVVKTNAGVSLGHGLEWWEAKGTATLSTFTGTDTASTKTLLTNCRAR